MVFIATVAGESFADVCHCVIGASVWPESIRVWAQVCFPYRFQDHAKGFLYNPVVNGGDTKGSLFAIGFGDVHPSDRHRFKGCGLECFAETLDVPVDVCVEVAHRASVYARRFSSLVGVDSVMGDS